MEPDPLITPLEGVPNKKTSKKLSMGGKYGRQEQSVGSNFNIVVGVLCAVCCMASVYNSWKDTAMESRLEILEERLAALESDHSRNMDTFMEKFRREVDVRFKQRVTRETASVLDSLRRTTRDAPECICPAGRDKPLF